MGDRLQLIDDSSTTAAHGKSPWSVLVVDDDLAVHDVTRLALRDLKYDNRSIRIETAKSAQEAMEYLSVHRNVAVALLDVVMETDSAGLDLVRHIREDLNNQNVRIILRTGQPGQAPERKVIEAYDINDYKEKTELTAQKLYTTVFTALRGYDRLLKLEQQRRGLEQVIQRSSYLHRIKNFDRFVREGLIQVVELFASELSSQSIDAFLIRSADEQYNILSHCRASGVDVISLIPQDSRDLNRQVLSLLRKAEGTPEILVQGTTLVYQLEQNRGEHLFLVLDTDEAMEKESQILLKLLANPIAIAYENLQLHGEIEETQNEMVYLLGESVETRSRETGNHVRRVAEYSVLLGSTYGLKSEDVETLRRASPLHDLGKIGVPDAILNKPGPLDPEELVIMRSHAEIGYRMLKDSHRPIFQAAATIALQHHEWWNGEGYPQGLREDQIHIYGRIVAIVDVFDALGSDRCYKKAWPLEKIVQFLKETRGLQFDPDLIDLFLDNFDKVLEIRDTFAD